MLGTLAIKWRHWLSNTYKPTLILLSTPFLLNCGDSDDGNPADNVRPDLPSAVFDLANRDVPLAIDLFTYKDDGTIDIELTPDNTNPVTLALSQLEGFSTNAALDIKFDQALKSESLLPLQNVFVVNTETLQPIQIEIQALTLADGVPILRIMPAEPMKPSTRYLVVLGDSIQTTDDQKIDLPDVYKAPIPGNDRVTGIFSQWTELGTQFLNGAGSPDNLALAYTFTTTSTSSVMVQMSSDPNYVNTRTIQWIDVAPQTPEIDGFALFESQAQDPLTQVFQGQIELPQLMDDPEQAPLQDSFWSNDTGNISDSNPLPSLVKNDVAPILMVLPGGDYSQAGGADCTQVSSYPVAVFIHGITSNRSSALIPAQVFASRACMATVVIDHPGHGMAPVQLDNDGNVELSGITPVLSVDEAFATTNTSPWAGVLGALAAQGVTTFSALQERHKNIGTLPTQERSPYVYGQSAEDSFGSSGSNFINLLNFARTRDNLRQALLDQLNVLASLETIDINGRTLNLEQVSVVGHSLGAIVATSLTGLHHEIISANEDSLLPNIQTLIASNAGGQLTRLLENSPTFSAQIVGGLAASGIEQGTQPYEQFFQIFQAMVDSSDAINFTDNGELPSIMFEIVGGGALPPSDNPDDPLGDINLPSSFPNLFSQLYPPDHVVPNFSYAGVTDNPFGFEVVPTAYSPLTGSTPLATQMGLELVNQQALTPVSNRLLVRYQMGTHSTFSAADDRQAFIEMMGQTLSLFAGQFTVNDETVLDIGQ